jgi:hypothetical protein
MDTSALLHFYALFLAAYAMGSRPVGSKRSWLVLRSMSIRTCAPCSTSPLGTLVEPKIGDAVDPISLEPWDSAAARTVSIHYVGGTRNGLQVTCRCRKYYSKLAPFRSCLEIYPPVDRVPYGREFVAMVEIVNFLVFAAIVISPCLLATTCASERRWWRRRDEAPYVGEERRDPR